MIEFLLQHVFRLRAIALAGTCIPGLKIVGPMLPAPLVFPTAPCFPLSDSSSAALLRTCGMA